MKYYIKTCSIAKKLLGPGGPILGVYLGVSSWGASPPYVPYLINKV